MPSVGRLIPVSGGFQNSAVGSSSSRSSLSLEGRPFVALPACNQPAPHQLLMRRETRSWMEINQDPNRSPPSWCVMMVLNPFGWKPDRSWLGQSRGPQNGWVSPCLHTHTHTHTTHHTRPAFYLEYMTPALTAQLAPWPRMRLTEEENHDLQG